MGQLGSAMRQLPGVLKTYPKDAFNKWRENVNERKEGVKQYEKDMKVERKERKELEQQTKEANKAAAKEARNTVYSGDKKMVRQDDGSYKITKKNDDGTYS